MTTYTTLDGKPLAWPQAGATLVHRSGFTTLLLLDCVLIPPPPDVGPIR